MGGFDELIERKKQGSLKIYLGYAAGVGKTYEMLQEGHRLKKRGMDVVIGYVEPHARPETTAPLGPAYLLSRGPCFLPPPPYGMVLRNNPFRPRRYPRFTSDPSDITVTYINGPAFQTAGLEAELKYQPRPTFDAFLNLNYIHGNRGDALPGLRGSNYAFVPMATVKAGLSGTAGAFTASLLALFQTRADGPLEPIPSWASWGLHLGYAHALGGWRLRHALDGQNLGDRERWFPENARRNLNAIPDGLGRQVRYSLTLGF